MKGNLQTSPRTFHEPSVETKLPQRAHGERTMDTLLQLLAKLAYEGMNDTHHNRDHLAGDILLNHNKNHKITLDDDYLKT